MVSLASDIFNALPDDTRKAVLGLLMEHQIRDIKIEMERAKAAYEKHMREARHHLKNVELSLAQWEKDMHP